MFYSNFLVGSLVSCLRIYLFQIASILFIVFFCNTVSIANKLTPSEVAVNYCEALIKENFEDIFQLNDNYQNEVSHIKRNNPKVLWESKIKDYFSLVKENFNSQESLLSDIRIFMRANPDISVLETRDGDYNYIISKGKRIWDVYID